MVLPAPCLVVLVGMSGSGKSTWAAAHFAPVQIVSSDALRAVVGAGEDDITASDDAFALLEQIVERRTKRRLTTVVDTLGLDPDRRRAWLRARAPSTRCRASAWPLRHRSPECRARNRERRKSVPERVLAGRPASFASSSRGSRTTGFDFVLTEASRVRTAPAHVAREASRVCRVSAREPVGLRFGLQVPTFDWPGGAAEARAMLGEIGRAAEERRLRERLGHGSLPPDPDVRPRVARHARELHDARVPRGADRAGATRHPGHRRSRIVPSRSSARSIATLDVVSGGRANCGLGVGWFAAETRSARHSVPSARRAVRAARGRARVPPAVLGQGRAGVRRSRPARARSAVLPAPAAGARTDPRRRERRSAARLRLAARYADACNIIGEADVVARKVDALRSHCEAAGRPVVERRGDATLHDARREGHARTVGSGREVAASPNQRRATTRRVSTPAPSTISSAASAALAAGRRADRDRQLSRPRRHPPDRTLQRRDPRIRALNRRVARPGTPRHSRSPRPNRCDDVSPSFILTAVPPRTRIRASPSRRTWAMGTKDQIEAANEAYGKAVANQDVAAVVSLYAPDAILLPPDSPVAQGSDAIRARASGVCGRWRTVACARDDCTRRPRGHGRRRWSLHARSAATRRGSHHGCRQVPAGVQAPIRWVVQDRVRLLQQRRAGLVRQVAGDAAGRSANTQRPARSLRSRSSRATVGAVGRTREDPRRSGRALRPRRSDLRGASPSSGAGWRGARRPRAARR